MAASISARAACAKFTCSQVKASAAPRAAAGVAFPTKRFGAKLTFGGSKQSQFIGATAVAQVKAGASKGTRSLTT